MIGTRDWSNLPDHILINIFSCMSKIDQARAAQVCSSWAAIFSSPYLWKSFHFWFYMPKQSKYIQSVDVFGKYFKRIYIELDQGSENNRINACTALKKISQVSERRLQHLTIKFTGENPYFYAGQEFVKALSELFGPAPDNCRIINYLTNIDLSGLTASFDDNLFNILSANNKELQVLNIQNRVLVCKVSPSCILTLVQRCRKLQELNLFSCSVNEDILVAFTDSDRLPLKHLSLICRREEKYKEDISGDVWKRLSTMLPDLQVCLSFDHTCPLHKVSEVMKPEVPIRELRLETFTYIYDELRLVARYYPERLEKLVIQTPMSRNSPEFNTALVELATVCTKLTSLHVFCLLEKTTVDRILALHPVMAENKSYTLKYEQEPHPWIAGKDC